MGDPISRSARHVAYRQPRRPTTCVIQRSRELGSQMRSAKYAGGAEIASAPPLVVTHRPAPRAPCPSYGHRCSAPSPRLYPSCPRPASSRRRSACRRRLLLCPSPAWRRLRRDPCPCVPPVYKSCTGKRIAWRFRSALRRTEMRASPAPSTLTALVQSSPEELSPAKLSSISALPSAFSWVVDLMRRAAPLAFPRPQRRPAVSFASAT